MAIKRSTKDCVAFGPATWHSCRAVVCCLWHLGLRGLSLLVFACFSWTEFIVWCLRRPIRGMPTRLSIFGATSHVRFGPYPAPAIKLPWAIFHIGGEMNKYRRHRGLQSERIVTRHISDKIKNHWRPTNPHHNQHTTQSSLRHWLHKTLTAHSLPTHLTLLCQANQEKFTPIQLVISSVWLQGKDKRQSCKSNKKTSEKFNNYINKQETKGSNNCVGVYKNAAVKIEK